MRAKFTKLRLSINKTKFPSEGLSAVEAIADAEARGDALESEVQSNPKYCCILRVVGWMKVALLRGRLSKHQSNSGEPPGTKEAPHWNVTDSLRVGGLTGIVLSTISKHKGGSKALTRVALLNWMVSTR